MKTKTILLILALAVGIFNACKKDHAPAIEPDSEAGNDKINQLLGNFTDNYETFKSGKWLKSGDKIDFDSVLWYIDGAINFNYASGHYSFERIHKDVIYVEVTVDPDMKSLLTNVFESYNESLLRIGEKYYDITGEYKKFIMATVSDAGPLPDGKRKLRVTTLTGTGLATQSGDFGVDESYKYFNNSMYNCTGEIVNNGAPEIFETKLLEHFDTPPPSGCRYFYVGTEDSCSYNYLDYRINPSISLTNYLDYKIFAAAEYVSTITETTECLEYNQNNSGIHEMQFYFDHLVAFANEWVNQQNSLIKKSYARSVIESDETGNADSKVIFHKPKLFFKLKIQSCSPGNPYFPTE